jgi:AraC-like DNA-binding protein
MAEVKILHINEFEQSDGALAFYCNDFKSHLKDHFHTISHAHKHDFFLTVLFTAGSGTHDIDFATYPIKPGSLFMMSPGQVHSWKFSEDVDGSIFFHSADFIDQHYAGRSVYQLPFFYSTQNQPYLQLTPGQTARLKARFAEMQDEYATKDIYSRARLVSLVDLVYLDVSRIYPAHTQAHREEDAGYMGRYRQLGRLIDLHFTEQKSAAYYAEKMNISTRHLNRVVQTAVGRTTSDLILDRVMLEARRKMVHENSSLTQIAYSLGYDDYAYFSKLFKARIGLTPRQFQQRYR